MCITDSNRWSNYYCQKLTGIPLQSRPLSPICKTIFQTHKKKLNFLCAIHYCIHTNCVKAPKNDKLMLVGIWTSWLLPAINLPPVFLNLSRVSSKLIMITSSSHDGIIGIITLIIPITLTNWTPPLWIWCACCVNKVLLAYDHPGKLLCSQSSIYSLFSLNASSAIMKKSKTIAFWVIKTI